MANRSRRHGGGSGKHKASPASSARGRKNNVIIRNETNTHFSLRDEARNTERNHTWSSMDLKLRHKNISFVSGGHLHGDKPPESPLDQEPNGQIAAGITNGITQQKMEATQEIMAQLSIEENGDHPSEPLTTRKKDDSTAFIPKNDYFGDRNISTVRDVLTSSMSDLGFIRQASTTPSDSSEDVVVFKGRAQRDPENQHTGDIRAVSQYKISDHASLMEEQPRPKTTPLVTKESMTNKSTAFSPCASQPGSSMLMENDVYQDEKNGANLLDTRPVSTKTNSWDYGTTPWEHRSTLFVGRNQDCQTEEGTSEGFSRNLKPGRKKRATEVACDIEDEAIADYIANLKESGEDFSLIGENSFSQRSLAIDDSSEFNVMLKILDVEASDNEACDGVSEGSDMPMYQQVDDLSISSEVSGQIRHISGKRLHHGKDSANRGDTVCSTLDGVDSEDTLSEGSDSYEEACLDQKGLIQKRYGRMTDEQLARLLAKQEELGISTDEVLLLDDITFDSDVYDDGQTEIVTTSSHRGAGARRKAKRAKGKYPSASLMADILEQDPYDGFDIMDFDRPSLRKKKGRNMGPTFGVMEEESEDQLQSTWEADREKKRLQKQKRQELRTEGLLGKNNKFRADLGIKYKSGITSSQLSHEVRTFWTSVLNSRAFPPMDKKDRKLLHEVALKLDMTSKSRGSGKNRFPVLSKTNQTPEFTEALFCRIEKMIDRRIGGLVDSQVSRQALVSYRNGEVVGAGAPEIGKENRGRAILEKMGWRSGTALGSVDNKGILEPISHTFKSTKHGLGQ